LAFRASTAATIGLSMARLYGLEVKTVIATVQDLEVKGVALAPSHAEDSV